MEKNELKFGHIRLTPDIITTINILQTGGTMHFSEPPSNESFDNCSLNDRLNELTKLNDLLIEIFDGSIDLTDARECMGYLQNINYLKTILSSFAAPQPEKQNPNI